MSVKNYTKYTLTKIHWNQIETNLKEICCSTLKASMLLNCVLLTFEIIKKNLYKRYL